MLLVQHVLLLYYQVLSVRFDYSTKSPIAGHAAGKDVLYLQYSSTDISHS